MDMCVFELFDSLDSSILRNLSYQCFRIVFRQWILLKDCLFYATLK